MIGLLDRTPEPVVHDQPHRSLRYAEAAGKSRRSVVSAATDVKGFDLPNLIFGEHRRSHVLANGLPIFSDLVILIVLMGSNEQMFNIATWRIVAMVTHADAMGDWAVDEFPCESVRAHAPSIDPESAVAILVTAFHPFVATGFCDLELFAEPTFVIASRNQRFQWVAVGFPPGVVKVAPAETFVRSVASDDRAGTLCHVGTPFRVGRAPDRSRGAGANLTLRRGCDIR